MAIGRHGFLLGWVALSAVAATCTGCAGIDPDAQTLAENGSDVSEVTARVSGLAASFGLGAGSSFDPSAFGETASLYTPAGCAHAKETAESVTVEFKNCSGPWGLAKVEGSVTVEPAPKGGTGMVIEAKGLHLGGATVTFDATWSVKPTGPWRSLTWTATLTGTTASGLSFDSNGTWELSWEIGGTCIDLTGHSQGQVAGSSFETQVTVPIERCNADCPTKGALFLSDSSGSITDTISFDGTDVATFTTRSGTDDIQLACGL